MRTRSQDSEGSDGHNRVAVPMPAHAIARFNLAACVVWLAASRRRLDDIHRMTEIASVEDGLRLAGDTWLGIFAFERALESARWVVANSEAARASLPVGEEALDLHWLRIRKVRNAVLAHLGTWILKNQSPAIAVDSIGLHLSDGFEVTFAEWRGWLDEIEPWARLQLEHPVVTSDDPGRRPPYVRRLGTSPRDA